MPQPSAAICPRWWFQILPESLQLWSGWTCTSEQQLTAFRSKKQQRQLQYFSLSCFLSLPSPNPLPAQAGFSLWNNLDAPGNCWILRLMAQQYLPCFSMLYTNPCLLKLLLCERDWAVPKTFKEGKYLLPPMSLQRTSLSSLSFRYEQREQRLAG